MIHYANCDDTSRQNKKIQRNYLVNKALGREMFSTVFLNNLIKIFVAYIYRHFRLFNKLFMKSRVYRTNNSVIDAMFHSTGLSPAGYVEYSIVYQMKPFYDCIDKP